MSQDVDNSLPLRLKARPSHIARLADLDQQNRLILAGPHPAIDAEQPTEAGFTGSLVVAQFNSLQDAKNWANDDPYFKTGVYQSVSVKPFKQVFPK